MKAGVSSYCFHQQFSAGEMDMLQMIQFVGKETVAECFEPLTRFWKDGRDEQEQAREARDLLDSVGLEVSCYTLDSDFAVFDKEKNRACIDQCIQRLDTALILGTNTIRLDPRSSLPRGMSPQEVDLDDLLVRVAQSMQEVADAAARKGIVVGVENHGTLLGRVAQVERMVELVNRPNFGVNLDFTNFHTVFGEDHIEATRRLAKKVVHVHAKDFFLSREAQPGEEWRQLPAGDYAKRAIGGEGNSGWPEIFRILKEAGYQGAISLEIWDPADVKGSVAKGVANIKRLIAEVEGKGSP